MGHAACVLEEKEFQRDCSCKHFRHETIEDTRWKLKVLSTTNHIKPNETKCGNKT